MDKGNGVCKFLNDETNFCSIYDQRPLLCNVNESYKVYFEKYMSLEQYHEENHKACKLLKSITK